jgi:hypothetical protein
LDSISQVDLVDRLQEKMKHNKMSVTERKQKRADGSEVGKFTQKKLMDPSIASKVMIMVAITTLLTNAQDMGNIQMEEGLLEMMLVMARSDEYIIQELVASKAIIAAASKEKDNTAIVNKDLDILQPCTRTQKTK